MKISLLTPTRNRPHSMQRLWESAWNTADDKENLEIVFYMDSDDVHSKEQFMKMDSPQHLGIIGKRIVLSQMWNECQKIATGEIFMHCFPAGELVMTSEGPRPIQDIQVGTHVMIGDGTLRPVVKCYERDYSGPLHTIKVTGMPPVRVTANHNIFASIGSWEGERIFAEKHKVEAGNLTKEHFTAHPIPADCGILKPVYASPAYARLAGWYLSEGSIYQGDSTWRISFDLHVKEKRYSDEIQESLIELMHQGFHSPQEAKPTVSIQGNCLRTWFSSTTLGKALLNDFGKLADSKKIPSWIMFGAPEFSIHLLRGMWLGDGHIHPKRNWHYTTVSPDLGYGMKALLARHGIPSSLEEFAAYVDRAGVSHKKTYRVYVSGEKAKRTLADLLEVPYAGKTNQARFKDSFPLVGNQRYSRVVQNTSELYSGKVYNIQVAEQHEYVVSCGLVANCGDDIIFRSQGWDTLVRKHINSFPDKIAFVHGMDGIQNERLGTHGFLHRNWVNTIGYFVPPYFSCDYNDTWLTDVSTMIGRRIYEPAIYTEHMHWAVGKQPKDQTYSETMARGHRDNVTQMYHNFLPKREEDARKLKVFIESFKAEEK